jgi:biopolymer transport protein TolR
VSGPVRGSRGTLSEINVTPLVDVMLVLLIIFMVAAPMIQQGVDVNLPKVVATELPAQTDLMVVTVDRTGTVHVGGTQVAVDGLGEKLKAIFSRRPSKEAYLRADQNVAYGVVVRVMAEMKKAGIERLGMVTEPPDRS